MSASRTVCMYAMASDCNNFRPNLWRPTTCANCYRPKSHHGSTDAVNDSRLAVNDTRFAVNDALPAANLNMKERKRSSPDATRSPNHHSPVSDAIPSNSQRQIGVVKPYAVFDIPEDRSSENSVVVEDKSSPIRSRTRSVIDALHSQVEKYRRMKIGGGRDRSSTVALPAQKKNFIPRRKAPPPPPPKPDKKITSPHPVRRNSTTPQPAPVPCARPRATTIASGQKIPKRTPPPQKPPRTLSTFITDGEQEALLIALRSTQMTAPPPLLSFQLSLSPTSPGPSLPSTPDQLDGPSSPPPLTSPPPPPTTTSVTSTLSPPPPPPLPFTSAHSLSHQQQSISPVVQSGSSTHENTPPPPPPPPPPAAFLSSGQLHAEIFQLMRSTLGSILEQWREQVCLSERLWGVAWDNLQLTSSPEYSAKYKGIPLSIEFVWGELEEGIQQEVALAQFLPPHPNLRLVQAVLSPPPSDSLLPPANHCLLRDAPGATPLNKLLPKWRESMPLAEYDRLLLLSLAQTLSAVSYLNERGVCHRDIGLDCLYATPRGSDWEVRLGGFRYALHRESTSSSMTFCYRYHELKWLGGADSRLPPEIMHTPPDTQSLDYRYTDCFAVGCLIYEALGLHNPFETDPELVYKDYTSKDLPSSTHSNECTLHSPHLLHLASLLVQREARKRPSLPTALRLIQVLLWTPAHWLQEPVSETQVLHWLAFERAALVAGLAKEPSNPPPLSCCLKAQFLLDCAVSELLQSVALLDQ